MTSWQQRVREAEQRLGEARRRAWLQTHHPELLARQEALAADPRATGEGRGDFFRWKWERSQVAAAIAAVCVAAGV